MRGTEKGEEGRRTKNFVLSHVLLLSLFLPEELGQAYAHGQASRRLDEQTREIGRAHV